jgi:uncharacterized protein YjdB
MAVTATAVRVPVNSGGSRPPGHNGWNNPGGDPPPWITDVDWYRRVKLTVAGAPDARIVNWECFDGTIPLKTQAEIDALADGASGALINNTTDWTLWAYTGANVAGKAYRPTGQRAMSTLRANGNNVQVLLGPARKLNAGVPTVTWTITAYLPGQGKLPSAQTTFAVQYTTVAVTGVTVPATLVLATGSTSITATVAPAGATFKGVSWTTSSAAAVSIADPNVNPVTVTRVAPGAATITATTVDGGFTGATAVTEVLEDETQESPEEDTESVEMFTSEDEPKAEKKNHVKKGRK